MGITTEENTEWKKKAEQQYKNWENSIDGICYNMVIMPEASVNDEGDMVLIAETFQKIPARARDIVLEEAVFVLMNGLYGSVSNGFFRKNVSKKEHVELMTKETTIVTVRQPLIFLNFGLMKKFSKKRKMGIIAHEIAHVLLKHHFETSKSPKEGMKREQEADDLIVKWGFDRSYKSYKVRK